MNKQKKNKVISPENKKTIKNVFISNTPKANYESFEVYADILAERIADPYTRNIGIIAPYGGGKSTLIATYKDKYNIGEEKSTTVTLATFSSDFNEQHLNDKKDDELNNSDADDVDSDDQNEGNIKTKNDNHFTPVQEYELEKSILQQLLYREDKQKLPNSRIRRLKNNSKKIPLIITGLFFAILLSISMIVAQQYFNLCDDWLWYCGALGIVSTTALVFLGIFTKKIKGFKFLDLEAQFYYESGISVLNATLDEILYFFENVKCEIVFFEDLDRFDNLRIFTKLRELNYVINTNKNMKQRKVTFVYAIKDTMFQTADERAKFFEFVISIVPIVSPQNARGKIVAELESRGETDISKQLIDDVSLYVNDMRLINNIVNDYFIYKQHLNFVEELSLDVEAKSNTLLLNKNKLFAMMVYKNLEPHDFALLQKNEGRIKAVFDEKKKLIEKLTLSIDKKIEKNNLKMQAAEKEKLKNFQELLQICQSIIWDQGQKTYSTYHDCKEIESFKSLAQNDYISTTNIRGEIYYIKFTNIEAEAGFSFLERENILVNSTLSAINETKKENQKLAIEKHKLLNANMVELLDQPEKGGQEVLINSPLAYMLVSNGYIDEMYQDYINRRENIFLTNNDIIFLRAVTSKTSCEYEFKLGYVDNVIAEIPVERFGHASIFNNQVLEAFLNSDNKRNKDKKEKFFEKLVDETSLSNQFVLDYLRFAKDKERISLLQELCSLSAIVWSLINDSDYDDDLKKEFIYMIAFDIPNENILKQRDLDKLTECINTDSNFLNRFKNESIFEKIANLLTKLNVKFRFIDRTENSKIYEYVIDNFLYDINFKNILHIMKVYCGFDHDSIYFRNFHSIKTCKKNKVTEFILDKTNINKYFKEVFLSTEIVSRENDIDFIDEFIKPDYINTDIQVRVIEKSEAIYNNVFSNNINVVKALLNYKKLIPNWKNVLTAFKLSAELMEDIVGFIKSNVQAFVQDASYIKDMTEKKELSAFNLLGYFFINYSFNQDEINLVLIPLIPCLYFVLDFTKLTNEKNLIALIENNYFSFNQSDLSEISKFFHEATVAYFAKYEDEIINDIENVSVNDQDWINIILSNKVSESIKLKIIDKGFLDDIETNNGEYNSKLKNIIVKYRIHNAKLVTELLKNGLSPHDQNELLDVVVIDLSDDEIKECIAMAKGGVSKLNNSNATFEITDEFYVPAFFQTLKKKGIILYDRKGKQKNTREIITS